MLLLLCFAGSGIAQLDSIMVIAGAKIYPSPDRPVINDGVIVIRNGKIAEVGTSGKVKIPAFAKRIDAKGKIITAGFWNAHVHFIEPWWSGSDTAPAAVLERHMEKMLTSRGFTHVFEVATLHFPDVLALRRRIESGEVKGPSILTAGVPFTPPNGSPFYIAPLKLPEIGSAEEAIRYVKAQIDSGADGIKIWSSSPIIGRIMRMPLDVVKAAVVTAHELRKPVFAHPTDLAGVSIAVAGGVDILTHVAAEDRKPWPAALLDSMIRLRVAITPTMKLHKWELERARQYEPGSTLMSTAVGQLQDFVKAGGEVLFGTDVGYVSDPDLTDEFAMMKEAGMGFKEVLRSLTTAPSARFGWGKRTGKIEKGMDADLVMLDRDPGSDIAAFTAVLMTMRKGRVIFEGW